MIRWGNRAGALLRLPPCVDPELRNESRSRYDLSFDRDAANAAAKFPAIVIFERHLERSSER
jgi:hypothetical protein